MSEIPPIHTPPGYSNYPRNSGTPGPDLPPPGVYWEYIGQAWRMVQADLATWAVSSLIVFGVSYAVNIPLSLVGNLIAYGSVLGDTKGVLNVNGMIISFVISMLGMLVTYPLQAGFLYMGLRHVRGERVSFGDLFSGFAKAGHVILAMFLQGLFVFIGTLLCIVPGFYVAGALAFVPLLVMDKDISGDQAISMSYNALKPFAWSMFAFLVVVGLVSALGACLCGIGLLFTYPIYVLTMALTYNNFFPPVANNWGQGYQIGMEPPR